MMQGRFHIDIVGILALRRLGLRRLDILRSMNTKVYRYTKGHSYQIDIPTR